MAAWECRSAHLEPGFLDMEHKLEVFQAVDYPVVESYLGTGYLSIADLMAWASQDCSAEAEVVPGFLA